MVEYEARLETCRSIIDDYSRRVNASPLKLFYQPSSRVIFADYAQNLDFGAQGYKVVGQVRGSSKNQFFRDEVSYRYGCFSREFSSLGVDVSVYDKVPDYEYSLSSESIHHFGGIRGWQCQLRDKIARGLGLYLRLSER